MKILKCLECGKEFEKKKTKKYCSTPCRMKSNGYNYIKNRPIVYANCIICGTQFCKKRIKHVLCKSKKCRATFYQRKIEYVVPDPMREPFVLEMIAKYDNIVRIATQYGFSINDNSDIFDKKMDVLVKYGLVSL